jgi:hypothetical protein
MSYFLGVDDGQFGKIIAHEIPAIRQAFNRKSIDCYFKLKL